MLVKSAPELSNLLMYLSTFVFLLTCWLFQGRPRMEIPPPNYVSLYSDSLPNTSNQTFGSRICTELGKELMRMDKLLLLTTTHQKTKSSPEMQPCWQHVLLHPWGLSKQRLFFFCFIFIKLSTKQAVSKIVASVLSTLCSYYNNFIMFYIKASLKAFFSATLFKEECYYYCCNINNNWKYLILAILLLNKRTKADAVVRIYI